MGKNRGITLIALVITIIILLILAGITINLTLGEHGIIKQAQYAKEKTLESDAREQLELALLDLQTLKYTDTNYNQNEYINHYLNSKNMNIDGNIVTINEFQFEIDRSTPKIGKGLEEEVIDTSPAYEGLGYKFIYDGSLNEIGNTGANMCNDLTGGWTEKRTTYVYNGTTNQYYNGWLYANNIIDLSGYSKLYVNANIVGANYCSYVYGAQIQYQPDNSTDDFVPDITYDQSGIGIVDIPQNWKGYIGIYSCHSVTNTWYYDYAQNYVRNYTNETRYIDVYEIVAIKEDNWKKWLNIAKINETTENCNTLEEVLNNTDVLQKLFNDTHANDYLLKCSGTLMIELLKTDEAFSQIPDILKQKMKDNVSWNKFATICGRAL